LPLLKFQPSYIAFLFITPYSLAGDCYHLPDYMAEATNSLSVITKMLLLPCNWGRVFFW